MSSLPEEWHSTIKAETYSARNKTLANLVEEEPLGNGGREENSRSDPESRGDDDLASSLDGQMRRDQLDRESSEDLGALASYLTQNQTPLGQPLPSRTNQAFEITPPLMTNRGGEARIEEREHKKDQTACQGLRSASAPPPSWQTLLGELNNEETGKDAANCTGGTVPGRVFNLTNDWREEDIAMLRSKVERIYSRCDAIPKLSSSKVIMSLLTRRTIPQVRCRKEDEAIPGILLLPDLSGSCEDWSREAMVACNTATKSLNKKAICIPHFNGICPIAKDSESRVSYMLEYAQGNYTPTAKDFLRYILTKVRKDNIKFITWTTDLDSLETIKLMAKMKLNVRVILTSQRDRDLYGYIRGVSIIVATDKRQIVQNLF